MITHNEQVSGSSPQLSVLFAPALRHEAEKHRFTTFAQGSELEHDDLASMHNCINTEVRFRALLTQDEVQKLEVVRAYSGFQCS